MPPFIPKLPKKNIGNGNYPGLFEKNNSNNNIFSNEYIERLKNQFLNLDRRK